MNRSKAKPTRSCTAQVRYGSLVRNHSVAPTESAEAARGGVQFLGWERWGRLPASIAGRPQRGFAWQSFEAGPLGPRVARRHWSSSSNGLDLEKGCARVYTSKDVVEGRRLIGAVVQTVHRRVVLHAQPGRKGSLYIESGTCCESTLRHR